MRRVEAEHKVEAKFCARMEECGWLNDKLDAHADKKAGNMDRIFYGYGARAVFIEFKKEDAPKKRQGEKLQAYRREELIRRGFEVYVVKGRAQAEHRFKYLTGEALYGVRTER